jgi:hypothetical protein
VRVAKGRALRGEVFAASRFQCNLKYEAQSTKQKVPNPNN